MIDVKDCIGKRIIMRGAMYDHQNYYEVDIVKLSPNRKYVWIAISGETEWKSISDFGEGFWKHEIVDILGENIFEKGGD